MKIILVFLFQVFDGQDGLKLHPDDGFTGDTTPDVTLSADRGELFIRYVLCNSLENLIIKVIRCVSGVCNLRFR